MRKSFNMMKGGYEKALENLRRHEIRLYVTFILGYDEDNGDTLRETLEFAQRHKFYIVAFNHLTPFPGTPLYARLQKGGPPAYTNAGGSIRITGTAWFLCAARNYGATSEGPLRRSAAGILRLPFHFSAWTGFQSERQELVHVEPLLFDQPFVSFGSAAAEEFPAGVTKSYTAPLVKAQHYEPMVLEQMVS